MSTTEVKSNLAKLLATENLTVEHTNVPTASFNVDTRILYLPIWDNITNDIYDLLVGHEVGHAIYTPREYETEQDFPRSFLNVVEDARIERLMKQKYLGLAKSFHRGYTELNDRDFFEIADEDVSKMSLIDRINLHFKIGIHNVSTIIPFTEEENQFVEMTSQTETFDDVIEVCKKIAEHLRSKKKEQEKLADVEVKQNDDHTPQSGDTVQSDNTPQSQQNFDNDADFDRDEDEEFGDEDFDDEEYGDELEESSTDRAWSDNQRKLIDQNSKKRLYLVPPQIDWSKHIIPVSEFSTDMDQVYVDQCKENEYMSKVYDKWRNEYLKFKQESNKAVSYLIKEFEMKKRADEYSRASVAKTGVIDTNKLFSYRWSEDIFKKTNVIPTGKSHGLIMYVDWSGSMSNSLDGTIKQLINLISFCKKVSIPFQVFAFSDQSSPYDYHSAYVNNSGNEISVFSKFRLIEFFNSDIKGKDFEKQIIRIWNLMKMINYRGYGGDYRKYELGGTPLNDCIFSAIYCYNQFKKKHRVDKVNTVFLTDGESNHLQYNKVVEDGDKTYVSRRSLAYISDMYNVCLKDPKTGFVKTNIIGDFGWNTIGYNVTTSILEYYKWMTGSKVVGFRLADNMNDLRYLMRSVRDNSESENLDYRKKWKSDKCFTVTDMGYDELYVLENGSEFNGEKAIIDSITSKSTKNKLRNQFRKYMKTKMLNKVVLSKFVDQIA